MLIHVSPDPQVAAKARAAIVANDCLTFGARGMLLMILAHVPEWDVNVDRMAELTRKARGARGEGKGVVGGYFRELERSRYLVRTVGGGAGYRIGTRLDVYDVPRPSGPLAPESEVEVEPDARRGDVVYVIGEAGSSVVKIGTTSHVRKRLTGIQSGCPIRLEVRWSAPGSGRVELLLHGRFEPYRIHGEWFNFGRLDPVKEVQKEYTEISNSSYEEMERQLREYGAVVDFTNL